MSIKPCPSCGNKRSHIIEYDCDVFRRCSLCQITTVACASVKAANNNWNDRRSCDERRSEMRLKREKPSEQEQASDGASNQETK